MNTLPRAITAQVLADPTVYRSLRAHWGTLMRWPYRHGLAAAHHLLYLALIGKDWRRSFTPISRETKLKNGNFAGWGLFRALSTLHASSEEWLLAPFDGLITPEALRQIRQMIPYRQACHFQPEQFASGSFPFDAYALPAVQPIDAGDGEANV